MPENTNTATAEAQGEERIEATEVVAAPPDGVRDEFAREGDERHFAGRFAAKSVSRKVESKVEKEEPKHEEWWPPMPVLGDGAAKG